LTEVLEGPKKEAQAVSDSAKLPVSNI